MAGGRREGRKERGLPQKQASRRRRRRRRRCFQRNNKGRDPFMQVPREYNSAAAADRLKMRGNGGFSFFMCFPPFLYRTLLSFSAMPDVLDKLFSQVYQLPKGQGVKQIKMFLGPTRPRRPVYPGIEPFRDNAGREYQLTRTVRIRNLVLI